MEQVAIRKLKNAPLDYFAIFISKFFFSVLTCVELYYFSAFLTDTAMFSLAIIGVIQMVTTIIDGVLSLVYGVLMTKIGALLPWGETRSWLLIAPPIATILFCFAMCRISDNEVVSAVIVIAGFILSHLVWSIAECAMNAQCGIMTDDVNQRAQMSMNLGRGTLASSLVFGYVAGIFLSVFAASPLKYVYMLIVFGILYWLGYIFLFVRSSGCEPTKEEYRIMRERQAKVAGLSSRTASMGLAYKSIFTSKNGLMIMVSICVGYLVMFLASGLMFYYFAYTLQAPQLMGSYMSIRGLVSLLGGIIWVPILLKLCRNSKRWCLFMSNVIVIVFLLIEYFFVRTSVTGYYVIGLIHSFLGGGGTMMTVACMTDVGAELTHKTGKELGNFTVSFMALPLKVSLVLRSALITAAIGTTGYVAGMEITDKQINGFAAAYLLWGAVLSVLTLIAMIIYKLPEAKAQEMIAENNAAREADEAKVAAALAEMGEE